MLIYMYPFLQFRNHLKILLYYNIFTILNCITELNYTFHILLIVMMTSQIKSSSLVSKYTYSIVIVIVIVIVIIIIC